MEKTGKNNSVKTYNITTSTGAKYLGYLAGYKWDNTNVFACIDLKDGGFAGFVAEYKGISGPLCSAYNMAIQRAELSARRRQNEILTRQKQQKTK